MDAVPDAKPMEKGMRIAASVPIESESLAIARKVRPRIIPAFKFRAPGGVSNQRHRVSNRHYQAPQAGGGVLPTISGGQNSFHAASAVSGSESENNGSPPPKPWFPAVGNDADPGSIKRIENPDEQQCRPH